MDNFEMQGTVLEELVTLREPLGTEQAPFLHGSANLLEYLRSIPSFVEKMPEMLQMQIKQNSGRRTKEATFS